jgi:hypothetical protein
MISLKQLVQEQAEGGIGSFNDRKKGVSLKNAPSTYYKVKGRDDKTLQFESRFESGNLALAIKLSDAEYNLIL